MEPVLRQLVSRTLLAASQAVRSTSPVTAALCEGFSHGPSPACEAVFDHYFRIISAPHINLPTFLAALHHLALVGDAPGLARFFPSCGGSFRAEDATDLTQAAETALRERREEILDFLLTHEPRSVEIRRATAVLVGALVTVDRFRGGLSLVQLGAADGLLLQFDRYAFQLGNHEIGESPLVLAASWEGQEPGILNRPMPQIVGRRGLALAPVDLTDENERRVSEAFIPPDQPDRMERFRTACSLMTEGGPPDLRQGVPELDLARMLVEAYNAMEPGNTLFLFSVLAWSQLSDEAQKRVALGLQTLASQVQPEKPIAWLQAEPFTTGQSTLELRLHTFGWADLEDRAVRKLAETDPNLTSIRWLE